MTDDERTPEQYARLVERLPVGVFRSRFDGTLVDVNPAFVSLLGADSAERLLGRDASDFYHDADGRRRLIGKLEREGTVSGEDVRLTTLSGERIWVSTTLTLTDRGDGRFLEGFSWEVTERKERERDLRRTNERLEAFSGIVSHDLRNPLGVADGRLELARKECDSDHLDHVAQAHDRMATLIEDLLTLAREADSTVEVVPVDLAALVEAGWKHVRTDGASLATRTEATILADRPRLQRLFENLFRNCVEHGSTDNRTATQSGDDGEHGSTSPRPQAHGDDVVSADAAVAVTVGDLDDGFYVEDDGPGIAPADRDRVFESGYSTHETGTGFGLSIVKSIAEAHGWTVAVRRSDSGGARFEITGVARDV